MPGQGSPGIVAGGSAAGANRLLWAWNETDVSQFDGTVAAEHLFSGTTLTVVTDTTLPGQKKLRLTAPAGSGGGGAAWLITAPLVFTGTMRRYLVEYEVADLDANGGGVCFMADDSQANFHGHQYVFGAAGWPTRYNNGTWSLGAQTNTVHGLGANVGRALVRMHVRGEKPAGSQPIWSVYANSETDHNVFGACMKHTDPGFSAWDSSWNSLACDRVGLSIDAGSGNAPVFDITALRIYSDGFDDVSV